MKIQNLVNRNGNSVANQFVLRTDSGIYFQSYDSMIAHYNADDDTLTLGVDYDYSMTTMKHLRYFIETYCPAKYHYESAKELRKMIAAGDIIALNKNITEKF